MSCLHVQTQCDERISCFIVPHKGVDDHTPREKLHIFGEIALTLKNKKKFVSFVGGVSVF